MSQFAAPTAGGSGVAPRDLVGRLVIAAPISHETDIPTDYGLKDAISLAVADLDTNEIHTGCLWFNARIVGALRRQLGTMVLARVTEGVAKPGQKPPYELTDATGDPAAVARAQTFVAGHPNFGKPTATPATSSAAAPSAPTAAPAAPAVPGGISADVLAQLPPESRALVEQLAAQRTA